MPNKHCNTIIYNTGNNITLDMLSVFWEAIIAREFFVFKDTRSSVTAVNLKISVPLCLILTLGKL